MAIPDAVCCIGAIGGVGAANTLTMMPVERAKRAIDETKNCIAGEFELEWSAGDRESETENEEENRRLK